MGEDRLREETPCPIKDAREPLLLVRGKRSCLHRDAYTRHFVSSATRRFDRRFGIEVAVVWNQRLGVGGPAPVGTRSPAGRGSSTLSARQADPELRFRRSSGIRVELPRPDAPVLRTPREGPRFPRRTNVRIPRGAQWRHRQAVPALRCAARSSRFLERIHPPAHRPQATLSDRRHSSRARQPRRAPGSVCSLHESSDGCAASSDR